MSADNLSENALIELLLDELCPWCVRELDAGWKCKVCGYDARHLAVLYDLERIRRNRNRPNMRYETGRAAPGR